MRHIPLICLAASLAASGRAAAQSFPAIGEFLKPPAVVATTAGAPVVSKIGATADAQLLDKPRAGAQAVGRIKSGDTVWKLEETRGWCLVMAKQGGRNVTGWVKSSALGPLASGQKAGGRSQAGETLATVKMGKLYREKFLNAANAYLGVRYKFKGVDQNGVDCSGLVIAALRDAGIPVEMPRTAAEQLEASQPLPGPQALKPGDLVFRPRNSRGDYHVMIVLKADQYGITIIEAPYSGARVWERVLDPYEGDLSYGSFLPK